MSNQRIKELEEELKALQGKKVTESRIKELKRQIKGEKFAQTRTGKVFNKIADIGDVGYRATKKFLSPKPMAPGYIKKKVKKAKVQSMQDIMDRLPQ